MIDRLNAFTLNLIKSNVSMVLIFYASGFLSFIAYYRVLGIPFIAWSPQIYAELAGRNVLIILQTFIFLLTKPDYLISIFDNLSWAGFAVYIWLAVIFILLVALIIFKCCTQSIIVSIQSNRYIIGLQLAFIAVAVIATFHIETQSFYAENVLQAANLVKFSEQKQNILNFEQQSKKIDYQRRVKIFNQVNSDNKIKDFFFSIPANYDETGGDSKRLNALMLIILTASITASILCVYRQYTFIKWLIFCFAFTQAILIPFNCGILGVKYQYPVISFDYTEKDKQLHKEAVFLLAKSSDKLIIYDRLNFFKISTISQSAVNNIEQTFSTSPFSNCSNGDFKPCELYAIK